jgi:UDP-N-acetylglucosamine 2-epimerase (non-hydrolysing)/GDP/UDP-N,N'-diacetylbacillosamine 2-epimerase (hydrolysing)
VKRKVAVFTGNRAEYGLQFPILKALSMHPQIDLRLIVSGAHLDPQFGNTLKEINDDGFTDLAEVKIDLVEDNLISTARAIGTGVLSVSEILAKIQPDVMIVYADRFESFAAIIASTQMNIPTAHVEGGDITEGGALDDSVRHAMTKLAHLHFTTNEQASNRVKAMGEEEWRVHTVGFPAIDLIRAGNYTQEKDVTQRYNLKKEKPIILFTQHSVTTEFESAGEQILPSLRALDYLACEDHQVIITYPNNDAGGKEIIKQIENFTFQGKKNVQIYPSLGRANYHGILNLARIEGYQVACVGNSSSGIKETPAFLCPTVNVGSRQDGRLRAENVIDAKYSEKDLIEKIKQCFEDKEFIRLCKNTSNPYGTGDAGKKIADYISTVTLDKKLLQKKMTLKGL